MSKGSNFSRVFAAFAMTARASEDLDLACRFAAHALGADGVGLTLALPATMRAVIGASGDTSRALEQAQLTAGEGPCTEASRTGRYVVARDLTDAAETRWPGLVRQLERLPVRAVVALPLTVGPQAIGSLDVLSSTPHGLDGLDVAELDGAAAGVTRAVLLSRLAEPAETGVDSRVWIEISQATGMVMAALRLAADDAVDRLRARAFRSDLWLSDVAHDVVTGRVPPDLDDLPLTPAVHL